VSLTTHLDGGALHWVPSVHFRLAFAEQVRRLCLDPATRPDAVAVELGPATAAAAADWLRELGRAGDGTLPCMLGLLKRNRCLRASTRELAARVQALTGEDLRELSSDQLWNLFGYSSASVLYLSPTDSIVEALRCGLELGVPVYGIDLEETARAERARSLLPDPSVRPHQLDLYIEENAARAEEMRDAEIDDRRDIAMAARLKTLLGRHRRVLFACGLAHFHSIRARLGDPSLRPALLDEATSSSFHRVVVHPVLAVGQMDLFPALAALYETRRSSAGRAGARAFFDDINATERFGAMLVEAYRAHFQRHGAAAAELDRPLEDWEARADFERLLASLCVLNQTCVPDMFTALLAAEGTMSRRFCRTLAEALMDFAWAAPAEHPGLPMLCLAPPEPGRPLRAQLVDARGRRSPPFYIGSLPESSGPGVSLPVPWDWEDEPIADVPWTGNSHTWPPCDFQCTAMSVRASQVAAASSVEPRTEVFEGSLCDGVDIKAVLRARIRGDRRFYVRNRRRHKGRPLAEDGAPVPIVWIFRPGSDAESGYTVYSESILDARAEVLDPEALGKVVRKLGSGHVWGVAYGRRVQPDGQLEAAGISEIRLRGVLHYVLPHLDRKQGSRWAEAMGYRRSPLCPGLVDMGDIASLMAMFAERHGVTLDEASWETSLVRLAIPYAEGSLTIVAPDRYELGPLVREEAARKHVELRVVPHSYFPRDELRSISRNYIVPRSPEPDVDKVPETVARLLGRPDANRRLVPPRWLYFGLDAKERSDADRRSTG
jgi:hypothetical protein